MFDPTACPPIWREGRLLPYVQRSSQPEPARHYQPARSESAAVSAEPAQDCRVLIVEDDPDNLFYAECAVEDLGYQWASTALGSMALPLVMAYKPDIILLDVWLKETTGFDVLAQLRQHPQTWQIPAIAVTALSMPREIGQISRAGFADYLLKPFLIEGLSKVLATHLPQQAKTSPKNVADY